MRVSASTPSVRITQSARIFGCAAKARVGLTSSHRFGAPAEACPSEIERHIWPHCLRAAFSSEGSLRSLLARLPICSLTVLSSSGFTSLETLSLIPATVTPPSAMRDIAAEVRLDPPGRQQRRPRIHRDVAADVGALVERAGGRASALRRRACCPSRPPSAPVRLPPWLAIWPVTRSEPFSVVEMFSPLAAPLTASGPRETVQPMSALPSRSASGFSFLPAGCAGRWPPWRRGWRARRPRPARRSPRCASPAARV